MRKLNYYTSYIISYDDIKIYEAYDNDNLQRINLTTSQY